jgi:hypothetical protein
MGGLLLGFDPSVDPKASAKARRREGSREEKGEKLSL